MTFANAQLAIETRFAAAFSGCPIKYENVDFVPTANATYAEISIIDVVTKRADIGPPGLHRSKGIIQVGIYTPLNIGTLTGRQFADAAAEIFKEAQFEGITCFSPSVQNVGETNGWWLTSMTVEFYRDETA